MNPPIPPGAFRPAALLPASRPRVGLRSELGLVLLGYVLVALAITVTHGHYSPPALLLLLAGTGALFAAGWKNRATTRHLPAPLEPLAAIAVIVGLLAGALDGAGVYGQSATFELTVRAADLALAGAVGFAFLRPGATWPTQRLVLLLGVALALGLRVGMIVTSPRPLIDVYTMFQESSAHLLQGLNPYATPVSDPWYGRMDAGYHVTGYSYPPANLYAQTLGYLLAGDVRYAYVAAEAFAAAILFALVAPARRALAALLVLLLLFHPVALFVLEQAWNELLMVGAAALFLWFRCHQPQSRWVAASLGLFLSLKQYLVFFAALYLAPRRHWRLLPIVAGVIVLTWLPFLLWGWRSALENGLWFQFRTGFRTDGLTLPAALHGWLGWTPSKWLAIGVGGGVTLLTGWWFRASTPAQWLYAAILSTLAAFLVGSQAFCNYYHFLGAMMLFLVALRVRETSASTPPTTDRAG